MRSINSPVGSPGPLCTDCCTTETGAARCSLVWVCVGSQQLGRCVLVRKSLTKHLLLLEQVFCPGSWCWQVWGRNSKKNAGEGPVGFALRDHHATALLCSELRSTNRVSSWGVDLSTCIPWEHGDPSLTTCVAGPGKFKQSELAFPGL